VLLLKFKYKTWLLLKFMNDDVVEESETEMLI